MAELSLSVITGGGAGALLGAACDSESLKTVSLVDPQTFADQARFLAAVRETLREHALLLDELGRRLPVLEEMQQRTAPVLEELQERAVPALQNEDAAIRGDLGVVKDEVTKLREELGLLAGEADDKLADMTENTAVLHNHIVDADRFQSAYMAPATPAFPLTRFPISPAFTRHHSGRTKSATEGVRFGDTVRFSHPGSTEREDPAEPSPSVPDYSAFPATPAAGPESAAMQSTARSGSATRSTAGPQTASGPRSTAVPPSIVPPVTPATSKSKPVLTPITTGTGRYLIPLADQVRGLQRHIERNTRGRERLITAFLLRDPPAFLRRYYRHLALWRELRVGDRVIVTDRPRPGVGGLMRKNLLIFLPRFWRRWAAYARRHNWLQHRRRRALRRLCICTAQGALRWVWLQLAAYRALRRSARAARRAAQLGAVDSMAGRSGRLLMLRYFAALMRYEHRGRWRRGRRTLTQALQVSSGKQLCRRYWGAWARWLQQLQAWQLRRRLRAELGAQLWERTRNRVLAAGYRKLRRFAEAARLQRERQDLVAHLAEIALQGEQATTEAILELKHDTDSRAADLLQRCDALGSELRCGDQALRDMLQQAVSGEEHHREQHVQGLHSRCDALTSELRQRSDAAAAELRHRHDALSSAVQGHGQQLGELRRTCTQLSDEQIAALRAQIPGLLQRCEQMWARLEGLADLRQRHDALGSQVDSGLGSLASTNSALNRVVDRLLAVDEHLNLLHKDKASRQELAELAAAAASGRVAVLHQYQHFHHGLISADGRPGGGSPQHSPRAAAAAAAAAAAGGSPAPRSGSPRGRGSPLVADHPRVSPPRDRGQPHLAGAALHAALEAPPKQRTAFMGHRGLISAGAGDPPPGSPRAGVQELDHLLARLDQRQRELLRGGDAPGGHRGSAPLRLPTDSGALEDVATLARRELDTLRLRDLERRAPGGLQRGPSDSAQPAPPSASGSPRASRTVAPLRMPAPGSAHAALSAPYAPR
eukprot:TRINITY_DN756_c0_g1_i1.p1 TRINITY_DN756_c0_g1~~TRINITY_DN756_c0_g1_i1.p1  ORF type:complete len:997 (+),score=310.56 TRINITY_DN756_c0_g1_i1:90-3080(+)